MAGMELHEASSVGDFDTLEDYLRSGKYDIDMKDPEWKYKTPLHWACQKGFVDCIRLLLEYGAKGTSRMEMGWTPAHLAAEAGKVTVLRALAAAGVSVTRKDKYGDRPRHLADIYGHTECCKFLQMVEFEEGSGDETEEESDLEEDTELEIRKRKRKGKS